jgi:hypothetical protein
MFEHAERPVLVELDSAGPFARDARSPSVGGISNERRAKTLASRPDHAPRGAPLSGRDR